MDRFADYCIYDERLHVYRCIPWDNLQPIIPFVPSAEAKFEKPPSGCRLEARCITKMSIWRSNFCREEDPESDPKLLKTVNKAIDVINRVIVPQIHHGPKRLRVMTLSPGKDVLLGDEEELLGVARMVEHILSSSGYFDVDVASKPGCLWGTWWRLYATLKE